MIKETSMTKSLSTVRVNSTDYASGVVIERLSWDGENWNVPAWEEQFFPEFVGPFSSHEEAQAVLDKFIEIYVEL